MPNVNYMPNLFVPGFAKSGTTHLCKVLSKSPDIFLPREKEPHYFAIDLVPESYRTNEAKFISMYLGSTARYRLDGSVSYLYSEKAMKLIAAASEDPRFIVMVRHPFDRILSHYRFNMRNSVETRSFSDAIQNREGFKQQWLYDYREMSNYSPQIDRLLSNVARRDQVRLVDYNAYRSDPVAMVHRIGMFLGVAIPQSEILHQQVNVSKQPKYPFINALLHVDTDWKKVIKAAIPFRARRNIKKFIHNRNLTDREFKVALDSYAISLQTELDGEFAAFISKYRDLYI